MGICGQGPSDHPDLAKWLMEEGIESLSLSPDTVVETGLHLAKEAMPGAASRRKQRLRRQAAERLKCVGRRVDLR